jgi:membrane-associated phospholipid phosphatase
MNSLRTARTFAYLNMAMMDAAVSCWDTKYVYHYPRPAQADPSIKTLLGVPNFPSYTSGHSTFSAAAANVLGYIFSSRNNEFVQMAQEASESRIYGGIHYRFDCESGLKVGKNIANFAIELMKADKAE